MNQIQYKETTLKNAGVFYNQLKDQFTNNPNDYPVFYDTKSYYAVINPNSLKIDNLNRLRANDSDLIKLTIEPINVFQEIQNELKRAEIHSEFNSLHEAYAIILEEVDEFWDEVKKKNPDKIRIKEELIQIAAMAVKALNNLDEITN